MSKATPNSAANEPVPLTKTLEPAVLAEPSFSDGELGQLQEILFGHQQRSNNEQMLALRDQLSEQIQTLSNVLNSRLNQLTESFDQSKKEFEHQLHALRDEHQASFKNINATLNTTKADLQTEIATLSESANDDTKRLNSELQEHRSQLLTEISKTNNELQSQIESSAEKLQSAKLDKQSLAGLLTEISNKLTDSAPATAKN